MVRVISDQIDHQQSWVYAWTAQRKRPTSSRDDVASADLISPHTEPVWTKKDDHSSAASQRREHIRRPISAREARECSSSSRPEHRLWSASGTPGPPTWSSCRRGRSSPGSRARGRPSPGRSRRASSRRSSGPRRFRGTWGSRGGARWGGFGWRRWAPPFLEALARRAGSRWASCWAAGAHGASPPRRRCCAGSARRSCCWLGLGRPPWWSLRRPGVSGWNDHEICVIRNYIVILMFDSKG